MSEPWARFVGPVRGGKVLPFDRNRLQRAMAALEGKRVEFAIREEQPDRTLSQNAHIHVLAKALSEYTGDTLLYMKRLAVLSALGLEAGTTTETILGREFTEVRPTSDLTKAEGSLVIDWLKERCEECNVATPRPEHVEVIA